MLCLPGFTPVAKLGPGHGRLRRLRRLQLGEGARLGEPLQVRQLALVHELPGQRGVHAVEAHDEDALLGRRTAACRAGRRSDAVPRRARRRRPDSDAVATRTSAPRVNRTSATIAVTGGSAARRGLRRAVPSGLAGGPGARARPRRHVGTRRAARPTRSGGRASGARRLVRRAARGARSACGRRDRGRRTRGISVRGRGGAVASGNRPARYCFSVRLVGPVALVVEVVLAGLAHLAPRWRSAARGRAAAPLRRIAITPSGMPGLQVARRGHAGPAMTCSSTSAVRLARGRGAPA